MRALETSFGHWMWIHVLLLASLVRQQIGIDDDGDAVDSEDLED